MAEAGCGRKPARPDLVFRALAATTSVQQGGDALRRRGGGGDGGAETDGISPDPAIGRTGEKPYPLDTEAHVRAAWAYIHQATP